MLQRIYLNLQAFNNVQRHHKGWIVPCGKERLRALLNKIAQLTSEGTSRVRAGHAIGAWIGAKAWHSAFARLRHCCFHSPWLQRRGQLALNACRLAALLNLASQTAMRPP